MVGAAMVLGAAALWGTIGPAQTLAASGIGMAALAGWRHAVGGICLVVLGFCRSKISPSPARRRSWVLLLVTGVASAAYQFSFMSSVSHSGAAMGTVVAISAVPLFTGIAGRVLDGERLSALWCSGTVGAVGGCVVLLRPETGLVDVVGLCWGGLAGITFAAYTTAMKRLSARTPSLIMATAGSMAAGALVLAPWIHMDIAMVVDVRTGLLVVWLGLAATAVPYLLYARGLRTVKSGTAGALTLAEPLTAALLSVALLGERIAMAQAAGCLIILSGMLAIVIDARRRTAVAQPTGRGMAIGDSVTMELPLMPFASPALGTTATVEIPVIRRAPARIENPRAGPAATPVEVPLPGARLSSRDHPWFPGIHRRGDGV
ncbi:DMT family transporter [Micromonospora sp. NPDC000668]|uniref:DMT family transporter n=1 Tax=Micromonospora sp. NPDC000668 TaxID=3364219 RepID=UPI00367D77F3